MKIRLLNIFVALTMILSMFGTSLPVSAATETKATINCDGNPSDWGATPPAVSEAGDVTPPGDITAVYLTFDSTNVYFRVDAVQGSPPHPNIHIGIDADRNTATGYNVDTDSSNHFNQTHGVGIDYLITVAPSPPPGTANLYSMPTGAWAPGSATSLTLGYGTASPTVIEVALPRSSIAQPMPWKLIFWTQPPAGPPSIDEAPNNAHIGFPRPHIFVSDRDGNLEIYKMIPDGTGQTNMTNNAAADNFPMLSPNGAKIAFVSERDGNREIYVMNTDGSGSPVRLTNDGAWDLWPTWSPDSTKIIFTSYRDGNPEIYTMSATDGTSLTRLTTNTAGDNQPAWSPDGTKIAFSSSRDGNPEIYVMNADGTNQLRLTTNSANDGAPFWSPDSTKIAFTTNRDGNHEIYVMNADSSSPANLTNNAATDFHPIWLNNNKILFTSDRDGDPEVFIMNSDGTGQTQTTTNTTGDWVRGKFVSPVVNTLAAENITATGARLKGDLIALGSAPSAMVSFEWGTSISYGNTTSPAQSVAAPGNFTFDLTGLATGVQIHYRAKAAGDASPAYGGDVTFTPGAAPPPPPPPRPIVFVSDRDGNLEIYKMNPDGSGQTRLTTNTVWDNLPMLSPDGTKIAFLSERDGNREIYVMNTDGTSPVRLTNNGAKDGWPAWSPDGSKIAFSSTRDGDPEIYTMSATDGTSLTQLTNNTSDIDAQPVWSPDGSKIAFSTGRDGNSEIYVMSSTNGSGLLRLTNNPATDTAPFWSPDGTKIAFVTDRDGNHEVYVMNADGSSPANLTNNTATDSQPVWQPNGKIVFFSNRDGDAEVFIMDSNGANQLQITTNTANDWSRGKVVTPTVATLPPENMTATGARLKGDLTALGTAPSVMVSFEWGTTTAYGNTTSPEQAMTAPGTFAFDLSSLTTGTPIHYRVKAWGDGPMVYGGDVTFTPGAPPPPPPRPIVFVSDRDGNLEIYKMNSDGSGQTRLTTNTVYDNFPALSPDGTKIVFTSERDGNREIYVMNADGTNTVRLTTNTAWDYWPAWSPDGTKIVFATARDGNMEIYTMSATDGTNLIRLTTNTAYDSMPAFSPDGTKVAFQTTRDGNPEIYVMNANGTNQTRLTDNITIDSSPFWSPDGSKIAFNTDRDGNSEVYIMNASDGSSPTNLTNNTTSDGGVVWLPNGRMLFTSNRDGDPEIFIMDANGANLTQLTTNTAGDWSRGKFFPPTVATLGAENITATSARLRGDLTNLGSASGTPTPVIVSFEWGTSTSYGNTTSPEQAMTTLGNFFFDLSGLATGVPIHYRAKARGDASIAYGSDVAFTPGGEPVRPILFVSDRDGNLEIYKMNPDGSGQTNLTNNPSWDNTPARSPSGDKIAFTSERDGNREIYVMNADGTGQTRVTDNPAWDYLPTWSPDETKIAFVSSRDGNLEIYVMDVNGANQTRLTNNPAVDVFPVWSKPPLSKIAFVSERDGNSEIYVMNADGTNPTRLTDNPARENWPTWSPDNSKLAFGSDRDGNPEIYVMNADGSSQTRMTTDASADNQPKWSPDGAKIVFTSNRDGDSDIFVMDTNGANQLQLTTNTNGDWSRAKLAPATVATNPATNVTATSARLNGSLTVLGSATHVSVSFEWGTSTSYGNTTSPEQAMTTLGNFFFDLTGLTTGVPIHYRAKARGDGYGYGADMTFTPGAEPVLRPIVFTSDRDGNLEVYRMNPDGSGQMRLTTNAVWDNLPMLSPDGTKIVFVSERDGNREIYVMNADGTNPVSLTNTVAWDYWPAWSPDGTKIVFATSRDGNMEIYTMSATDGTNLTRLTNDPAGDTQPTWSPDGTKIAFNSSRDGNVEIYIMNAADGSGLTRLTNNTATDAAPVWSPDGTKIAFHTNRDVNSEVYVLDIANPTVQTNLTNNTANEAAPLWLPNGKIVFNSNRDGDAEVFIMDSNGTNQTQLTTNTAGDWARGKFAPPTVATLPAENITATGAKLKGNMTDLGSVSGTPSPAFVSFEWGTSTSYGNTTSPEQAMTAPGVFTFDLSGLTTGVPIHYRAKARGDASPSYGNDTVFTPGVAPTRPIVFISDRDGNLEVYRMNVDGTNQIRLTDNTIYDNMCALSPDGTRIVFTSARDGNREIYVMNVDGTNQVRLTNNTATDYWPDWSPDGTKIVFVSDDEIYVMNADGTNHVRLTNNTAADRFPAWSPDGTKIAFNSSRDVTNSTEIYVMNADGTNTVRLTNNTVTDRFAAWSPDNTKIAFSTDRDGNMEIYVMNVDGTNPVRLTTNTAQDYNPIWLSSVNKIIFTSNRDGNNEVYIMNADGTSQTRLTNDSASDFSYARWTAPTVTTSGFAFPPISGSVVLTGNLTSLGSTQSVWAGFEWGATTDYGNRIFSQQMNAPGSYSATLTGLTPGTPIHFRARADGDGGGWGVDMTFTPGTAPPRPIVFVSDRDGDLEIYKMNADGSNQIQLTNNTVYDNMPMLSPDGSKIVFSSERDGNREIYVMDVNGGTQTNVTNNAAQDYWPAWSPDGTKIAFATTRDGGSGTEIYVMDSNGANPIRLTNNGVADQSPSWSPDGTKLTYNSMYNRRMEIYVMNANGTNQTRLTDNVESNYWPSWSPDGAKIAFNSNRNGNPEIYIMDTNGANQVNLTNNTATDSQAVWLPNSKIVFWSTRDGEPEVFIMDANGANQTQLTSNTAGDWSRGKFVAPTVVTNDATSIANTSATLIGDLTALGTASSLSLRFDWGRSTDYDNPTVAQNVTATGAFNIVLTGLMPNTTYHFRAVAGGDGLGYGVDKQFTTSSEGVARPVVFVSDRDGNLEIYKMNPDGTSQTRLTYNMFHDNFPMLSPDGTKIAFVSERDGNREIYVMNADGTNTVRLTNNTAWDYWPAWSPIAGSKIVFATSRDGNMEIYVMSAEDGTNLARLTTNTAGDSQPAWSPDGTRIAFNSSRDGNPEIYIMNAGDLSVTRLTDNPATDASPVWSPDSTKIAFHTNRDVNFEVYVLDVASPASQTNLTNNSASDLHPVWLPDGKIVFTSNRDGESEVFIMDSNGANLTQLTTNTAGDWSRGKFVSPTVATLPAENITATSARLKGNLTDIGSVSGTPTPVMVSFEWGTSTSYGNTTSPEQAMAAPGTFAFDLSGLTPGTPIHYRARARGDASMAYGADMTFTPTQQASLAPPIAAFFGGSGDQAGSSISVNSGAVYASGNVLPLNWANDALVVKYPSNLSAPQWSRTVGSGTFFSGITANNDGVFVAGANHGLTTDTHGDNEAKSFVTKFNSDGTSGPGHAGSAWATGGPGNLRAFFSSYDGWELFYGTATAVENSANVIYTTGVGEPTGFRGAYTIAKYDSAGNYIGAATDSSVGIAFNQVYAPSTGNSYGYAVTVLNGNIYAAGTSRWTSEGDNDQKPAIWKYNPNLNLLWRQKNSGITGWFNGITALGNNIYAVGTAVTATGGNDFLIEKYDESGNRIAGGSFGLPGEDVLMGVVTIGSRLFAVGYTKSIGSGGADAIVLEIDPVNFNILSTTLYGGAQDDKANGAATDGTYLYVVGESRSFAQGGNAVGQNDLMLLRYSLAAPTGLLQAYFTANAQYGYSTNDNAVGNVPLDFRLDWQVMFLNQDPSQTIPLVTLTADATNVGPITGSNPSVTPVGNIYTWEFTNVPPYDNTVPSSDPRSPRSGRLLEGKIVNRTPGFTSSRQVDREVFDAPGTQTVTVTVTPYETYNVIRATVEGGGPGETDLVRWEAVGASGQSTSNPTVGQTYIYQFILNVTPKAGAVKFLPTVNISCSKDETSASYNNTTSVSAQAADNSVPPRIMSGTVTTSQAVQTFYARGRNTRNITYNRVSAPPAPMKEWTFLVYMAADNDLNDFGIDDLNEMEVAGSTAQVNVVALLDLYGPDNTRIYYVQKEAIPTNTIVSTIVTPPPFPAEYNMGDPATLTAFINWATAQYPAQKYALILWNHGTGWKSLALTPPRIKAIAFDSNGGNTDYLTTIELGNAMTAIRSVIPGPILLGFDACFMQMVEVSSQIGNSATIMTGSEEVEPADGWPYDLILNNLTAHPTWPPAMLGKDIQMQYIEYYSTAPNTFNEATMSNIDQSKIPALVTAINAFADALVASGDRANIAAARAQTEHFDDLTYIDLYDFADKVQALVANPAVQTTAEAVKTALLLPGSAGAVSSEWHGIGHPNSHGLSIYFPQTAPVESGYANLAFAAGRWDEFLAWFLSPPPSLVNLRLLPATNSVTIGQTFDITIQAEAGTSHVIGIDAFVNFDPTKLAVVDANVAEPGIQITPGSSLPIVLTNSVVNSAGTIDFGAGVLPPTPYPTGTFTVAAIRFQAIAETSLGTAITFNTSFPRTTIVVSGGNITGTLSGATVTITVDAPLILDPGSQSVSIGQTFNVAIKTNISAAQPVSGVAAYLNFDPSKLEVVDANVTVPGIQIAQGIALPTLLENVADNTAGTINFSAGKLGGPFPTGVFTVATIQFRAKAESTSSAISFSFAFPRITAVDFGGTPISGNHADATVTIIAGAMVNIDVVLQGGTVRPDAGWIVPMTVKFFTPGANVVTDTPLYTFNLTTAKSGATACCQTTAVNAGNYDITAVTPHTLMNVRRNVAIGIPSTAVYMGTLLEGDANDSRIVNIQDFGILAVSYGKTSGTAGFDARADFNRNNIVNIQDFGLLAINYSKTAPVEVTRTTVSGTLRYNGSPLFNFTNANANLWVRNEDTGQQALVENLTFTQATSQYSFQTFAGNYGVQATADPNGNGWPLPGDFYAWGVVQVNPGVPAVSHDVNMMRILHMTSPGDNNLVLPATTDPKPVHSQAQTTIRWDAIPEATSYELVVDRYREQPYGFISNVLATTISGTEYIPVPQLPVSLDGEFYQLSIYAHNPQGRVGMLMVKYQNGYGWDYRFRVGP